MSDKEFKADAKADGKDAAASASNVLNINVGVLGHVDSGKTSLSESPKSLRCLQPPDIVRLCSAYPVPQAKR
jgi:hypothetical protein